MYIPFLAKQSKNAWQLAVLPCVFGMLFYYAGQYNFGHILVTRVLLGVAIALLAFVLTGGLRACAIGLDLFLVYMVARAVYYYLQPDGFSTYIALSDPVEVITVAFSAGLPVNLARALLPRKLLGPHAKENFKSFFWIAGVGIVLFTCTITSILLLWPKK